LDQIKEVYRKKKKKSLKDYTLYLRLKKEDIKEAFFGGRSK